VTHKVHERLSPERFVQALQSASCWALIYSEDLEHALELYMVGEDVTECFVTPDFTEMRDLEVEVFFLRLNQALKDPHVQDRRLRNGTT
jgi:hypothetical protein